MASRIIGGEHTAITYNAGTNTIQIVGYTEATPCNFTDIYNADVAGGWGVVTRQCTNQFCIDASLEIGDGSTATWFADNHKHVYMVAAPYAYYWGQSIRVRINAHFRLGTLLSATDKRTHDGCSLIFNTCRIVGDSSPTDPTGYLEFYSTIIYSVNRGYIYSLYNPKIYNCMFIGNSELNRLYEVDIYNIVLQSSTYGAAIVIGAVDTLKITDMDKAFHYNAAGSTEITTTRNIIARNNTTLMDGVGIGNYDHNLLNVDSDTWHFSSIPTSRKFFRQYEFDLKVIDKDNVPITAATVKIWDKNNVLVVDTTTNASGVIATQILNYGYYNAVGDTAVMQTPHLIKIEKAGYTTYEADFTIGEKTDWLIALQAAGGGLMRNPPMTGGMV